MIFWVDAASECVGADSWYKLIVLIAHVFVAVA